LPLLSLALSFTLALSEDAREAASSVSLKSSGSVPEVSVAAPLVASCTWKFEPRWAGTITHILWHLMGQTKVVDCRAIDADFFIEINNLALASISLAWGLRQSRQHLPDHF